MKKKTLLITGTSGFIGNLFLKNALKKGYDILDILRSNNKKNKDLNDLRKKYKKNYKSIFYSGYSDLSKKLRNKKIDYFINFATLYKNTHSYNEIPKFIDSNITFPTMLMDLVHLKTKKMINFGTMMQHSNGKDFNSKNLYGSTKSAFEIILDYYNFKNQKLKFYNLKFYESFDENDKRKKLIPTLIKNYKKNEKTTIISKKLELNLIHVKDIINAVNILLKNNLKSGTYCLKNVRNIKIKNLIKNINKKSKKELKIKFLDHKINKFNKNYFKILPNWSSDKNIEQKVINQF